MSTEFPSFSIQDGKPIAWKGKPLKVANLQEVLFAARKARYFSQDDTIESARERWDRAKVLLDAVIGRMPSIEILDAAIPIVPSSPTRQWRKMPQRIDFIREVEFHMAMADWDSDADEFKRQVDAHHKALPDLKMRFETWEKYGGESGIDRLRNIQTKLLEVLTDLNLNLSNPYSAILELSFEILPPGLWNSGALIPYLGGQGWDEKKIVPERIDHLISLNPQMIFRGNVYRGYKDYLLFLFGKGGPAVLETPIHGNATYILHREWLTLCQRSKHELIKNPDVTRIIHHNMTDWRYDVCRALNVKPPSNANEY